MQSNPLLGIQQSCDTSNSDANWSKVYERKASQCSKCKRDRNRKSEKEY